MEGSPPSGDIPEGESAFQNLSISACKLIICRLVVLHDSNSQFNSQSISNLHSWRQCLQLKAGGSDLTTWSQVLDKELNTSRMHVGGRYGCIVPNWLRCISVRRLQRGLYEISSIATSGCMAVGKSEGPECRETYPLLQAKQASIYSQHSFHCPFRLHQTLRCRIV